MSDSEDSDEDLVSTIRSAIPVRPPSAEDCSGKRIIPGSLIKTLSMSFIKKSLPPTATEAEAARLADKRAIVHDITPDKIYVEIVGGNVVSFLSPTAVVLHDEGQAVILGDETEGRIGSFVQIVVSEEEAEEWVPNKRDTCGRTGRIVRVKDDGRQILVQFAWGSTFTFEPSDLHQSDQTQVETKDSSDPPGWLKAGQLVHLTDFQEEFLRTQRKNRLPAEPSHAAILGGYFVVKKIYIRAFSSSKAVQVSNRGCDYIVNSEVLTLIDSVEDREGKKIRVGDKVKVHSNLKEVKGLQLTSFGGWEESMENYLGIVGLVMKLGVPRDRHQSKEGVRDKEEQCVCIKVKFYDGSSFYFNPDVVTLQKEQLGEMFPQRILPWEGTIQNTAIIDLPKSETLEMIDSQDLECFEVLGQGAFGCVVRGTWRHKNGQRHRVAVKKIKLENVKAEAILKEANIQFSLDHPNIVKLYGIHQVTVGIRELWMVMNLINGDDLFSLIFKDPQPHNKMTFERKVKLCQDMCSAISYIHSRRYLHCDIKPQNMMIDKNSGILYVCDFGITRFLGDIDAFMTRATQYTGGISGTLAYIPPECFKQDPVTDKYKRPTTASDVWAIGVVIYEVFSERLFCDSWLKLLQNIATNNEDFVKKQIVNVPERIREMTLRVLNFSPKLRPTALELYDYFHEL